MKNHHSKFDMNNSMLALVLVFRELILLKWSTVRVETRIQLRTTFKRFYVFLMLLTTKSLKAWKSYYYLAMYSTIFTINVFHVHWTNSKITCVQKSSSYSTVFPLGGESTTLKKFLNEDFLNALQQWRKGGESGQCI